MFSRAEAARRGARASLGPHAQSRPLRLVRTGQFFTSTRERASASRGSSCVHAIVSRPMAYFINLFTEETWQESRENASWAVTGHTERLRNRGRIQPGDIFLGWLTSISAFVGALRVTGDSFESGADGPRIWRRDLFPLRYPTE